MRCELFAVLALSLLLIDYNFNYEYRSCLQHINVMINWYVFDLHA